LIRGRRVKAKAQGISTRRNPNSQDSQGVGIRIAIERKPIKNLRRKEGKRQRRMKGRK